jgi:hypothetical protein
MEEMDRYALVLFDRLAAKVLKGYESYEFHAVYHAVNNFCSVDMSSFYLNVLKDRMYCSPADAPGRKSAQTALFEIAKGLLALVAPVLSFTADEAWGYLPKHLGKTESVFLADLPGSGNPDAEAIAARWERILALRYRDRPAAGGGAQGEGNRERPGRAGDDRPGPLRGPGRDAPRGDPRSADRLRRPRRRPVRAGGLRKRRVPGPQGEGGEGAVGEMRAVLEPRAGVGTIDGRRTVRRAPRRGK